MKLTRRHLVGGLIVVLFSLLLLTVCDDRKWAPPQDPHAQREAQLQAEQAQRAEAELKAHEAAASRIVWITVVSAVAGAGAVVLLLLGIHVGSHAVTRFRKERHDG